MSGQNAVQNEPSLVQENAALRSRVSVLEEELALVQEQLSWLKKQIFGRKTEQSSVIYCNCAGKRSGHRAVSDGTVLAACRDDHHAIQIARERST